MQPNTDTDDVTSAGRRGTGNTPQSLYAAPNATCSATPVGNVENKTTPTECAGQSNPRPRMPFLAHVTTSRGHRTLDHHVFDSTNDSKFLKIGHHDSIVYCKHELILTFLAGATSDLTTTQEPLDLPARFLQQILLLPYFVTESFA